MARETYVWDPHKRDLVPKHEYEAKQARGIKRSSLPSPQVMRDIQPFVNVAVDGKEISSRSQKREMMKQHGLVEVGTEKPTIKRRVVRPRETVRQSIKKSLQQLGAT